MRITSLATSQIEEDIFYGAIETQLISMKTQFFSLQNKLLSSFWARTRTSCSATMFMYSRVIKIWN
uniref:Putative ovule protein n=1 Tax=Solanum chacoense TaxID=4108 RepID=A0A0V0IUH4_SOLCH